MADNLKTQRYIKFFVYLVAVVLINIVGVTLFFRVDLTAGNKYSLSAASRQAVRAIAEPLTIKVFFTENLPPPHNTTERYLHDLLATYAVHAGKQFNYRFYNVTSGAGEGETGVDANRELARQYGVYPVQVQSIEADEVKVRQAYMGLVIIHGDMMETISPLDTTEGLEYRITTGILKLVNKISAFINLDQPVDVRLVLSSALYPVAPLMGIDPLRKVPETVQKVVSDLNSRLSGILSFETIDPTRSPERLAAFEDDELLRLQWPAIDRRDGSKIPAGEGVAGLVMTWREKRLDLPIVEVVDIPLFGTQYSIPDSREIATMIEESLERLIGINDQIGYLADHGTLDITPGSGMMNRRQQTGEESLMNFRALVEKSYSLHPIRLGEDDLTGEYGSLIIARPDQPFSDYDLYRIDQYLMRGNNLALFLDQFQSVDPRPEAAIYSQPEHKPINTGLEKLLAHYGVTVKQSLVMDESCYRQRGDRFDGGAETAFYFAPLIKNQYINNDPDFMKNIKGLVTMKVSPLVLDPARLAGSGLAATVLFSSSDQSWEVEEQISFNPMFIRPPGPGEERQSYPLASLVEGEFPSYFADRKIPQREAGENGDNPDEAVISETAESVDPAGAAIAAADRTVKQGKPAGIFIMGSSQMLGDHMLDSEGRFPNSIFIMNLLDRLNGQDDMALLRSKQQAYNPIDEIPATGKSLIKWVNIAGLPVLVMLSGFLVMMLRLARKRRIRMMFLSQAE